MRPAEPFLTSFLVQTGGAPTPLKEREDGEKEGEAIPHGPFPVHFPADERGGVFCPTRRKKKKEGGGGKRGDATCRHLPLSAKNPHTKKGRKKRGRGGGNASFTFSSCRSQEADRGKRSTCVYIHWWGGDRRKKEKRGIHPGAMGHRGRRKILLRLSSFCETNKGGRKKDVTALKSPPFLAKKKEEEKRTDIRTFPTMWRSVGTSVLAEKGEKRPQKKKGEGKKKKGMSCPYSNHSMPSWVCGGRNRGRKKKEGKKIRTRKK